MTIHSRRGHPYANIYCPYRASITPKGCYNTARGLAPGYTNVYKIKLPLRSAFGRLLPEGRKKEILGSGGIPQELVIVVEGRDGMVGMVVGWDGCW